MYCSGRVCTHACMSLSSPDCKYTVGDINKYTMLSVTTFLGNVVPVSRQFSPFMNCSEACMPRILLACGRMACPSNPITLHYQSGLFHCPKSSQETFQWQNPFACLLIYAQNEYTKLALYITANSHYSHWLGPCNHLSVRWRTKGYGISVVCIIND